MLEEIFIIANVRGKISKILQQMVQKLAITFSGLIIIKDSRSTVLDTQDIYYTVYPANQWSTQSDLEIRSSIFYLQPYMV